MDQSNQTTSVEEKLISEHLLKHSTDLISLHNKKGTIKYVSTASLSLLGFEPSQLIGVSTYDLLHPHDKEKPEIQSMLEKEHHIVTYRIRRKQGDYIWLESSIHPFGNEEESHILCISRDITARKLAEEELRENQEKYRLLVEHAHDTIGIITKEGALIYINKTGNKLFGVTSTAEIIGQSIFDYIIPDDHLKIKKHLLAPKTTTDFIETTIFRCDRERRQIDMKLIPTIFKGRDTKQIIIRDITNQKKTEEMLQQTEKLSVVGHLAAGIAHEIRNPLTTIKGFTQLIKEETKNHYADVMLSELNRIDKIVSDLLILAKPEIGQFEKTDLKTVIENVVSLLNTQAIMNNIEIKTDFDGQSFIIECEPDKLKQVFINVIKNAIEASENNGKITIHTSWLDNEQVLMQVQDEGIGIPPERIPKLGEPFYSTKEKGTGLGLMMCNKIIKAHNGTIKITSEESVGTTVHITLPKSPDNV